MLDSRDPLVVVLTYSEQTSTATVRAVIISNSLNLGNVAAASTFLASRCSRH